MPVSDDAMRKPSWVPYIEGATLSRDDKERFMKFELYSRSYRYGSFLQQGYNPNHNTVDVEKVDINTDSISLRGN